MAGFSQHQKRLQRHLAGISQELAATLCNDDSTRATCESVRPAMVTLLMPEHCQNRLIWSRRHARWTQRNWNQVMFPDESRFCLSKPDGRERVWHRRGEHYAECCVRQYNRWGGASVMVWAGISFNHKSPLVVINGNITARRYIDDVLDPVMVPFLNTNPDITVFHQNNVRSHNARITREYIQQVNVEVLPWPAYYPDLSPIEHLWDQLGHRLVNRTLNPETGNSWWLHCMKSGPIYRRIASDVSFAQCAGAVSHVLKHTVALSHTDSCVTSIFGTTDYHVAAIDDSYYAYSLLFVLKCLVWYKMYTGVQFYSKILYNSKMVKEYVIVAFFFGSECTGIYRKQQLINIV